MKYSAVSSVDGKIVKWQFVGHDPFSQRPYLVVKAGERITVETDAPYIFSAVIEAGEEQFIFVSFLPDTPPILHRGKGGPSDELLSTLGDEALRAYREFLQETRERLKRDTSEFCEKSQRVDGKLHTWEFDGDDPWVVCCWCGERRRA